MNVQKHNLTLLTHKTEMYLKKTKQTMNFSSAFQCHPEALSGGYYHTSKNSILGMKSCLSYDKVGLRLNRAH